MSFFNELDWKSIGVGAIIAAFIVSFANIGLQAMRNKAERKLAKRKFEYDQNLAERKFEHEQKLAERKQQLEIKRSVREKHQQLAEEGLAMAYDVKFIINFVRKCSNRIEAQARERSKDESESTSIVKDDFYVLLQRYESEKETIHAFITRRLRMRAWFGEEADEPFEIFSSTISQILTGAQIILRTPDMINVVSPILKVYGEPDWIDEAVDRAIQILEVICRPILSEQPDA